MEIHRYLHNSTKRKLHQHELQKEKANDRKQLYEAEHLYLMIALDTGNVQENHHLKHSLIAKTTSHINVQRKLQFSPLDGAYYANFSSNLAQNR